MKHKSYKYIITLMAIGFLGNTFAQKFEKKFTENFKTNKDVEIAINASNTDINVTTWINNEVQIDAFIEIEGIDKIEAEKYFNNWEFEALGNSKKVKITSKGSKGFSFKNDFVFFDNMDFDIHIPEMDFSGFDTIVIPDMDFDFDFDFDFDGLYELEELGENGKYEFIWNDGDDKVVIKSKKEWEAFKKTKKYKELKEKMSSKKAKLKKKFSMSKAELSKKIKSAQEEYKKVDKEKIKKQLAKAKEELKKLNFHFSSDTNEMKINGKKVKIKKRLEIKVPKGATFDLNTRHCKVNLPNTVAYGNVKYGSFDANNLNGGELTIDYSPVTINDLNACTLFLNNVTDAKIASVTNTTMNNNSSGVNILRINQNVNLSDKFGELTIDSFHPNFCDFVLELSQSNAIIILGDVKTNFDYDINTSKLDNKSTLDFMNKIVKNYEISTKSTIINNDVKNNIKLSADYSTIIVK